jgi:MFS family permease
MNMVTSSKFLISLMATVASLPLFFFTLPAGSLADLVDRKKLLCLMNLWLALSAGMLAVFGAIGMLNPYLILTSVFLIGVGFAFNAPAWSSLVPEVVSNEELPSAVTLGGLQLNACGILGPAAAAVILSHWSPNWIFAVNAGVFLLVVATIAQWKRKEKQSKAPLENFFESIVGAIRYVRYAPGIQVVLARNTLFSLFISAIPALLPVIGLKEVLMTSADLGLLFTSMGLGSVMGAILVIPRARVHFAPNALTILASILLAIVFVLMAMIRSVWPFMAVAALAGVAWTVAASELWVAGQRAMPPWARGRMNATHIMLSNGGMALGGLIWGGMGACFGAKFTLLAAAALLLSSLALAFPLSIDFAGKLNFDPAAPTLQYHSLLHLPHPDDGPVTIVMDFQIDPANRSRFMELMRDIRLMHLRNGAFSWRLDEDLGELNSFRLEMLIASWSEHLLQHERITREEQEYIEAAWQLDLRPDGPIVKHYISVSKELSAGKRLETFPPPPLGHGQAVRLQKPDFESAV